MHDLLRISDLDSSELIELLELAIAAKKRPHMYAPVGNGRVCAVLFEGRPATDAVQQLLTRDPRRE